LRLPLRLRGRMRGSYVPIHHANTPAKAKR